LTYLLAFVVGGLFCVAAQLVVDVAHLTPAHTLVLFVTLGALGGGLGLYAPLVKIAGAGAIVPLPGFGDALVQGIIHDITRDGAAGIFSGGLEAAAMGITGAVVFGYVMALLFSPKG